MDGKRFYSFKKDKLGSPGVRFFALDSNYMTRDQLEWLEKELSASGSDWKIPFFHHPLYSSGGRHGSEEDLRAQLEPLFLKYGVNAVFAGHEHFYERLKPQNGIFYFTAGGSAKLREGDIRKTAMTAVGFDADNSYMLVEIAGDAMHFQTLSRTGKRVDSGTLTRQPKPQTQQ
jgi:3',5'-cyclic AMP phosphodiesterase CpdA